MDCYEVVRELVEDGIVKAGVTVGEGGLITALRAMTSAGTGADVSLRDISKAYGGERPVRILFSEVPGVIIQIADIDYDYVDAELILQDVVYFPLGHPVPGRPSVELTAQVEIPQILESLLNTLEGED
jgi:phosphoribosylformylglycinamidine (FGAM) synthase-like enzyme